VTVQVWFQGPMTERIGIGAFSAIGEAALFECTYVQTSKGTSYELSVRHFFFRPFVL
jgi:hypothetical protein